MRPSEAPLILLAETTDNALNWTVLTPVVAGALAIWYLLPTAQKRPLFGGVLAGLLAIAGLAGFLLRGLGYVDPVGTPQLIESVLFFGFAGSAVLFAGLMITNPNPGRSAICFAMVVLSTCGLFLLLAAPFLMAATIIIYAGAIIVTFLFVIMLSHQNGPSNADLLSREPLLAVATGFVILSTLLVGLQKVYDYRGIEGVIDEATALSKAEKIDPDYLSPRKDGDLGKSIELTPKAKAFIARTKDALAKLKTAWPETVDDRQLGWHSSYKIAENALADLERAPFKDGDADMIREEASAIAKSLKALKELREEGMPGDDVNLSPYGQVQSLGEGKKKMPAANIAALGRVLFSDHLLAVELAGTLLLVATVGAIVIAGGRREHAR